MVAHVVTAYALGHLWQTACRTHQEIHHEAADLDVTEPLPTASQAHMQACRHRTVTKQGFWVVLHETATARASGNTSNDEQ